MHEPEKELAAAFRPWAVEPKGATSRQSHSSPTPRRAATLMRWLRSSGSSHTTSRGTRSPRASACPGKLCLPSLRSVADTRSTGTKWHEPWRPSIPGNAGIESHLATEDSPSMLGSPPRSKIAPRTPGWFAGNPPQPKSTGWGLVSQGDTQFVSFFEAARNRHSVDW